VKTFKSPKCGSCNSEMTLSKDSEYWICEYCQGEQGPIKRKANNEEKRKWNLKQDLYPKKFGVE